MTMEPVDVYVMDGVTAVPGVVVRLVDALNNVVAQPTTDVDGKVSFLLPAPATYQCRFYKQGVTIAQPLSMSVVEGGPNTFDVPAATFVAPTSMDPRLCVVYGTFRDPAGRPAANMDIQFVTLFAPLLVDSSPVLRERVSITTDKNGYACVTLYRCGTYDVLMEGFEDNMRQIQVPDAPNAQIGYLLFPTIKQITFSPVAPYSVVAGSDLILTPTILLTSGQPLAGSGIDDLFWTCSNPEVLSLGLTPTTVVLKGKNPGTVTVTATPMDTSIRQVPEVPISGVPITVTVT